MSMIQNRTWNDPTPGLPKRLQGKLTGMMVFKTISELLIQYAKPKPTHVPPLTSGVGYSTASRPRSRHIPNSTHSSNTLPNVFMYGRRTSHPIPQHSRIPLHPTGDLRIDSPNPGETIERLRTIIGREHHATESSRRKLSLAKQRRPRPCRCAWNKLMILLVTRIQKDQGMTTILPTLRRSECVPPAMNLCV